MCHLNLLYSFVFRGCQYQENFLHILKPSKVTALKILLIRVKHGLSMVHIVELQLFLWGLLVALKGI